MLEQPSRPPRQPKEASDLHRWAMLRMAINEDKCHKLAKNVKQKETDKKKIKEEKKTKEPPVMSILFGDLPSLSAMKTWRSKTSSDIRQKYGGKTEWDNGLTDSAYLMYGIPRASLKDDHLVKIKERHLRKKVTPRSINYSQSFSHYSTPMPEATNGCRDRNSMAGNSMESSLSTLSSSPTQSDQAAVPKHLPPNSVSVLPRNSAQSVTLNPVEQKNGQAEINNKLGINANSGINGGSSNFVSPNRIGAKAYTNRNNNNSSVDPKRANGELGFPGARGDQSTQTLPLGTKVNTVETTQNNFSRYPFNTTNSTMESTKTVTTCDMAIQVEINCPPPPPAPPLPPSTRTKTPIHRRPPHPTPKPKYDGMRIHKINMAPLHEALMGSLNKKLQRRLLLNNF